MFRTCLFLALALGGCATEATVDRTIDDPKQGVAQRSGEGTALCAAGGPVSDGEVQGVICLAPLQPAGPPATDGELTWTPGPLARISP